MKYNIMNIKRFYETITNDEPYYEGDISIHFKVSKEQIEKYSSIFSNNWINTRGIIGTIEHFILNHIDCQNLIIKDNNTKSEINKNITYKLFYNGSEIDEDVFNKIKKYNIL